MSRLYDANGREWPPPDPDSIGGRFSAAYAEELARELNRPLALHEPLLVDVFGRWLPLSGEPRTIRWRRFGACPEDE